MRCAASLLAIWILVGGTFRTVVNADEIRSDTSPKRYGVLCRWVDVDGAIVMAPKLGVAENQKGMVSNTTESPFVIGLTPDGKAQRPHIVVIQEGSSVEVTVAGRQPSGATVDVTIEQSKIGEVGTKTIGPNSTVPIPQVDISKKRVIDFVKYGEVLSIPLAKKRPGKDVPRVEVMIHADTEAATPTHWIAPAKNDMPTFAEAKRAELLGAVLASGGARLRCERVSRWDRIQGRRLHDSMVRLHDALQEQWRLAALCRTCWPRQVGYADALYLLTPMVTASANVTTIEMELFGWDWMYSIELLDSPSLAQNVRRLSGASPLWDLTIMSKNWHYRLLHDLTKIDVRHDLQFLDEHGDAVKAQLEEVVGQDRLVWCLRHDAPGFATLRLEKADPPAFTVSVEEAESAIPALKKAADLKQVLIIGEYDEDVATAAQAKRVMQEALPKVKIDTFVFTGRHRPVQR